MAQFDLVIFDLDGTLLDTIGDVAQCFNEALLSNGFPPWPVDKYPRLVGGDLETIVARLLPEESRDRVSIDSVKGLYRKLYAESDKPQTHPYEGIPELLDGLSSRSVSLAINTNKGQALAEGCMRRFFPAFEGMVVGYEEGRPSKPNPFGVNSILTATGHHASRTLYVGDGLTDLRTAQSSGISFAYVTWGQGHDRELIDESDYVVSCASDLGKLIMRG